MKNTLEHPENIRRETRHSYPAHEPRIFRQRRRGNFEEAMVALGKAVIQGNKTDAGEQANRSAEALRGHEKDVPHKNVSRIKEFQAFYGEMKRRAVKLAADAGTGNMQKTSLSYGRTLEAWVSCHKRCRD